jgi:tetratricopeptide (TPR) repeat protein
MHRGQLTVVRSRVWAARHSMRNTGVQRALMQEEQENLDRLLAEPDPLLVASLRQEELSRRRRRWWIVGAVLALATVAAISAVLVIRMRAETEADVAAARALSSDGWQCLRESLYQRAAQRFAHAVRINPNDPDAWNGLGRASWSNGNTAQARQAWQRCLQILPICSDALYGMGQLALDGRQFDEAEKYLLAATAGEDKPAAWWSLTRIYLLQGRFADADTWAQRLVATDPENEDAAEMLAAAKAGRLRPELRNQIEPYP